MDQHSRHYFAILDELVATSEVRIDRPRGSTHPRLPEVVYPVEYGELVGTTGSDGAPIDVFVGTSTGRGVTGVVLTADRGKRDAEIKLVVNCSDDERDRVLHLLRDLLHLGGVWVPRG